MLSRIANWIEIRKKTTPVHWLYGAICAFLCIPFGLLAGWVAMGVFAFDEHWNDKEEKANIPGYKLTGCQDWWEAFVVFMPGVTILGILNCIGILGVTWL